MPKRKSISENQPELIAEPRAEYTVTPQQQAEKDTYRERLRLHLKDPAFRQIEGFPIGEDEAILALSDPPYYTACPNPFLGEIIARWQQERTALRQELGLPVDYPLLQGGEGAVVKAEPYHREPFAADVSEGKNDPIYNAHSYHTKVPHKAIMRYILHYTDPGDIILDGFCGTGMTGVAAQLCDDKKTVESLGYTIRNNGVVCDENGVPFSRIGTRKTVLTDLSPAATFITYNYNTPVAARTFEKEARRILKDIEQECGWMYETWHPHCDDPGRVKGKINYTIWSDVFVCPQCESEMVFWDLAVLPNSGIVKSEWNCTGCGTLVSKNSNKRDSIKVDRAYETQYDISLGKSIRHTKQVPVLINYSIEKKRFEKKPDREDSSLIRKIENNEFAYTYPTDPMMFIGEGWGDTWRAGYHTGITHVHHFYTRRNLVAISSILHHVTNKSPDNIKTLLKFLISSYNVAHSTKMTRIIFKKGGNKPILTGNQSGTMYISSLPVEKNVFHGLSGKIKTISEALLVTKTKNVLVCTNSSSTITHLSPNSIDYLFIDPPFGNNLTYSELNFLWESWLRVYTNTTTEAIICNSKRKDILKFQELMENCFLEFYRVLKPGKWMTVEFHNSQNSVWNAIQEALFSVGFMIADVRTLDKQQGTFKQVNNTTSVKQDLIITAYKPTTLFEERFQTEAGTPQGAWDFTLQHLEQLPTPAVADGVLETLVERQGYLLYDRMVAFHIQRGLSVPLSAPEFYTGLPQRFLDRDGMYFTPSQAAEYDKRRLGARKVEQLALFVSDEKSALLWLRRELDPETGSGPQTYQDLQPKFIRELHQARHEALPELRDILEQNFLQDEAQRWYQPNPERQADLDALRQKALLREFGDYLQGKGRLKVFRSEAVRAGFSYAWKERDYDLILKVAERLPETVLQEDQNLLMYVHNAALRQQEKPRQMPLI